MTGSMKFGEKDYSLVPTRIKLFREQNLRGDIETQSVMHDDGSLTFKATVTKDRSDPASARGTGTAHYSVKELQKAKSFEKLETISVGRALSMLGYLNDGQVASTEEMEEYEDYRTLQHQEAIDATIQAMNDAKTLEALKAAFVNSDLMFEDAVVEAKDKRKAELTELATKDAARKRVAKAGKK